MKHKFLGIDIGGTKMRAVLLTDHKVLRAIELTTPKTRLGFIKNLKLLAKIAGNRIMPVGIGVPGKVKSTLAIFCPNIPYLRNFDFKKFFIKGTKIRVDNDASCFARAEFYLGAGRPYKSIFALTLGTGVGRAYAKSGQAHDIKFEDQSKSEKEFQKIRDNQDNKKLSIFVAKKLSVIGSSLKPDAYILGGGVLARKNMFLNLKKELKKCGVIKPILRSRFSKNSAAIGAALIWENK